MSTPSTAPEKKARTMLDVNKDYQMGCIKAGQLQYQIVTLQKDLDILNSTLRDLNFEGAHLQAVSAEAEKLVKAQTSPAADASGEQPKGTS